jgi:tyrosine-protein kinase Etk/Wzc
MPQENDTIDLRDVLQVLRRGSRWIVGGAVLGLLAAVAVTQLLPTRYEATATVLLRDQPNSQLPDIGRLGGLGGIFPAASGFETELEILTSRAVVGAVVDSLGLQLRVRQPAKTTSESLVEVVRVQPQRDKEVLHFQREGAEYRVTGPGVSTAIAPGSALRVPSADLVLRTELPDRFQVELMDREETITRVRKQLKARRAAGEVASVVYRDADPRTAAAVPNLLVSLYLQRRATSDRGVNHRRYEFLRTQTDSISLELARAEEALRAYQETSGAVDPALRGEAEFERAMVLRAQIETSSVEARTLREILDRSTTGSLRTQDLAAYPTFINNAAINDLLSRMLDLEVKRTELLHQRTQADPDVANLEETRRALENQLVSISRAYLSGLQQQQQEVQRELSAYRTALDALPAEGQRSVRLQREVRRLSETLLLMQSQLVGARLAALTEGGDVRRIDEALPPRKRAFPSLRINLIAGLIGGLMLGTGMALGTGYLGSRLHTAEDVERVSGIASTVFDPRAPLLLARSAERQSLLLVPLAGVTEVGTVARHLADTLSLQGRSVMLADLEQTNPALAPPQRIHAVKLAPVAASGSPPEAGIQIDEPGYAIERWAPESGTQKGAQRFLEALEQQYPVVISAVPSLDRFPTPALLTPPRAVVFVAAAGNLTRPALDEAVLVLSRLGIPVAGVVLRNGHETDKRA